MLGKVRLDIEKVRLTTLMKKLVEGPEIFDKMLEMIEKNEFFFKKKKFFNDVFLWAARMQQFWQTAGKH